MPVDVHLPDDVFQMPIQVRYYEADQQQVVYHSWYLNYFDEAFFAYFDSIGYGHERSQAAGVDWMLVHSEIDWHDSLRWPSAAAIAVSAVHIGKSSMTFDYAALRDGKPMCSARTVYVTVDARDFTRIDVPNEVRELLSEPKPLRRPRSGR